MGVLTQEQIAAYKRDGYLLIPHVFSLDQLQEARAIFLNAFQNNLWKSAPYSAPDIINDIFSFFPHLTDTFFSVTFFEIIKDLIGSNVVWIPECSIHHNRYIHWHKDTSVQEREGETSHHDFSAPLIQAAIYFQNNGKNGGGLTVLPGTHLAPDKYYKLMSERISKKIYYKVLKSIGFTSMNLSEISNKKLDIATRMGDLLLFDLRINHRSTLPKMATSAIDKLAIFNTFGNNNIVTRNYFTFMKNRKEPYYRYFSEYPLPDVVYKKANESKITIWY